MFYDDIVKSLGGFGRYQRRVYLLLCLPTIICAFHKLAGVFLQITPEFRCRLDGEALDSDYKLPLHVWNESYPWDPIKKKFSSCNYFTINKTISTCDSYIFDKSVYTRTIVSEWNLVCKKSYLVELSNSIFMLGVMLGSIIFGELSDRYGRKITFFISLVIEVIFGILTALAPEFITYTIARFIVGATTSGVFLVAYVIALEMVGPDTRLYAGVIIQMFFSAGYMLLSPIAFYVTDWRLLQTILTIIGIVFFSYWWFIPESIRWLLTKKRTEDAKKIISNVARENRIDFNMEIIDNMTKCDEKSDSNCNTDATIIDIFKSPNLRKKALIIFFDWFINSGTYYGLAYNTSILGENIYLNFFIAGFVELPAYVILLFLLNSWGRQKTLSVFMVIAGISLISIIFVPDSNIWLTIVLIMAGKLAITSSYGTVYIFTVEQFPTVIRNVALGAASTCAKIGSVIAPQVNLLSHVWKPFPMILFGSLALIGGCFSLVLPETLNKQLPETIADAELFGKKEKKQKNSS